MSWRRRYVPVLVLGLFVIGAVALTAVHRSRTVVFVLGDSIAIESNGWMSQARWTHGLHYAFHKIPEKNGRSTGYSLEHLERWLGRIRGAPEIILWNHGLHDVAWWPIEVPGRAEYMYTSPATYEQNLHTLALRLKSLTPNVAFLTTTPVLDGTLKVWNEDVDQYNEIARSVMKREGIPVIDLHAFCERELTREDFDDGVHWTKAAARKQVRFIMDEVRRIWPADGT